MKKIIDILETRLRAEEKLEEKYDYLCGFEDALKMVINFDKNLLKIGQRYFVITSNSPGKQIIIENMLLYRINFVLISGEVRQSYCFSNANSDKLIIHKEDALKLRVHKTLEDAEVMAEMFKNKAIRLSI